MDPRYPVGTFEMPSNLQIAHVSQELVATDAAAPVVRQLRVLVLVRDFSCIVVPSTSLSTVRR